MTASHTPDRSITMQSIDEKRVRACVNACEGIATDALELNPLACKDSIEAIDLLRAQLRNVSIKWQIEYDENVRLRSQAEHAQNVVAQGVERIKDLRAQNAELLAALKLAERNESSRLYKLPLGIDDTERKIVETAVDIYRAAILSAEGKP